MTEIRQVPFQHRAHRPAWVQKTGRWLLRRMGWRVTGHFPADAKLIIAGGPHTSNWDFVLAMSALLALDLRIHWLAKHSIFRPPLRRLFLWLGGIPVDRSRPEGIAERVADDMRDAPEMIIAITPEGTRSKVERWKTGFLRIAAAVPCKVVPVTLDYRSREIHLWPALAPGDDPESDIARIRGLFDRAQPRRPENY